MCDAFHAAHCILLCDALVQIGHLGLSLVGCRRGKSAKPFQHADHEQKIEYPKKIKTQVYLLKKKHVQHSANIVAAHVHMMFDFRYMLFNMVAFHDLVAAVEINIPDKVFSEAQESIRHRKAPEMGAAAFFCLLISLWVQDATATDLGFRRSDFPHDFVFGAGTSAYQYEGAVAEDGRSPSCWDNFTHAGKMVDKSTGDVAADGYHKYMEDVKLMSVTGLEAYRFSISWSRLIPNGSGAVNPKGLEYYNNLIDELVNHGIQVHITLHHLDLPQILEDKYGGWLSPRIVEDFTAYADICFREFGDRVTSWTTVNEPNIGLMASYDVAIFPPARCSDPFGATKCTLGNSSTEPYIAAHNTLLAHASVFSLYKEKYQAMQKGVVGISFYSYWSYPLTNSTVDLEAAQRCKDFLFGWILDPLVFGDYPEVMKKNVGSRLPSFTKNQSELIKGSLDFIGINHYYSLYVNDRPLETGVRDYNTDMSIYIRGSRTDPPAGQGAPSNIPSDPKGLQLVLEYLKGTYGNLPIYIQENGMGSADGSLDDTDRIAYLSSYMENTLHALRNGVNVRGYFAWAFMDLFELLSGYQSRYGLYSVDFGDERRPRRARLSARWYSAFLKEKAGTSALLWNAR